MKQFRKKIDKINKIQNPLPEKGIPENLTYLSSGDMKEDQFDQCMKIFKENMAEMYEASSWGLDLENKRSELGHRLARFLLVTQDGKVIAYCHFRFCLDDDQDPSCTTLYIYEMQVSQSHQRQGIGKLMMELCEKIAASEDSDSPIVDKIMLTVFRQNKSAKTFYQNLGYHNDDTCPSQHDTAADYEILSKDTSSVEWILL